MQRIKSVCVYCGSAEGSGPSYVEAAREFGMALARSGTKLVYGGGGTGMMGTVARATIESGGAAVGIIPEFLRARELAYRGVTEQIVTVDMHERKRLMFEKADAFVALPGGIGTLEELVEQLTWAQLGQHKKPILVLDLDGFWQPLLVLLDHMRTTGFIRREMPISLLVAKTVAEILPMLEAAADLAEDLPETDTKAAIARM